jgi:predicted ATPase
VLDAFGRLCRESGGERLVRLLEQYAPTWLSQLPALVSPEERERLRHETLGATPERMLREMAEMIEALTVEAPLVLVLEDLHWSDYATLDLLGALARRRETARLLVIGTYRPVDIIVSAHPLKGLKQELQGHGQCEEIALDSLTPPEVAAYLVGRFPKSAPLVSVIHRRTDGNPLFLINFVEYFLAQGLLRVQEGQWEMHGGTQQL